MDKALPPSFHPHTCRAQGLIKVGPTKHDLYYELHGEADNFPETTRVVLMCGMYSPSSSAIHTVSHLTATPGFSVLVFDHRGVGLSAAPTGRYTTSSMAQDVLALLQHIGWTESRSIHVVGVSLGGMIAQELTLAIPHRIASLTMTSTRAGPIPELPTFKVGTMVARQLTRTLRSPEHAAALAVDCLFPASWLDQPDPKVVGKTRRQVLEQEYLRKASLTKQTTAGKLGQFLAVTSHYVSKGKLGSVLSTIPRVHVIVGSQDQLIAPRRSKQLHEMIPGSTFRLVDGGGHTLPVQYEEEYHQWIKDVIAEAKMIIGAGLDSEKGQTASRNVEIVESVDEVVVPSLAGHAEAVNGVAP